MKCLFSKAIGVTMLLAQLASAQKLYPVDEGVRDKSFNAFRHQLLHAVERHDTNFIFSVLDPDIQNGFGGSGGIEEFKYYWRTSDPHSKLWAELSKVLKLGGAFKTGGDRKSFVAPYIWACIPDSLGGYGTAVATAKNIKIHKAASSMSPTIEHVSYDYLVICDEGRSILDTTVSRAQEWIEVYTPKNKYGYILRDYVRSQLDYRACFVKNVKSWKMGTLIAGD